MVRCDPPHSIIQLRITFTTYDTGMTFNTPFNQIHNSITLPVNKHSSSNIMVVMEYMLLQNMFLCAKKDTHV